MLIRIKSGHTLLFARKPHIFVSLSLDPGDTERQSGKDSIPSRIYFGFMPKSFLQETLSIFPVGISLSFLALHCLWAIMENQEVRILLGLHLNSSQQRNDRQDTSKGTMKGHCSSGV